MRTCVAIFIVTAAAALGGCMSAADDPSGQLDVSVDVSALEASQITRVTVTAANESQNLMKDAGTGNFTGTLVLPAGMQGLVATAFVGARQVGASNPTVVDIHAGGVSQATVFILDSTMGTQPPLSPIIGSLTNPTTAAVGAPVTFVVFAVSPSGAPLSYLWSSSCQDSAFTDPRAAMTSWTAASAEGCTISIRVSNGSQPDATRSFSITVLPAQQTTGAATVTAVFVPAPRIQIALDSLGCAVDPGASTASCSTPIASPSVATLRVHVFGRGLDFVSSMSLDDDCGGRFGAANFDGQNFDGFWLPPAAGGTCRITAHGTLSSGVTGALSAAVLALPGSVATAQPPVFTASSLGEGDQTCSLGVGTPGECGSFIAGTTLNLSATTDWRDGVPGSLRVTDSCGGGSFLLNTTGPFATFWELTAAPGTACVVSLTASDLQGVTTVGTARYTIASP